MLTVARLRELLDYDQATGVFTWRSDGPKRVKGARAGGLYANGYRYIYVGGKVWLEHRLAWLHVHGEFPPHQIDHRDNVRSNNAWLNLRAATSLNNSGNRGANRNNRSGYKGVMRHGKRWAAQISLNGKHTHLGVFDTPSDASSAYQRAAREHFGEFAKA